MLPRIDTGLTLSTAWSEVLTRANVAALGITCLAVFLHAADGLLVATALPSIVAQIGSAVFPVSCGVMRIARKTVCYRALNHCCATGCRQ